MIAIFRTVILCGAIPLVGAAQTATYIISTVAGCNPAVLTSCAPGFGGDTGPATSAELFDPQGILLDSAGNLYIADAVNQRIRKVTNVASGTGTITTVVGNGTANTNNPPLGDSGAATAAELNSPNALAFDPAGNLYIADLVDQVVRVITTSTGNINTYAGVGLTSGFKGDSGPAGNAWLSFPAGVAFDSAGNLYIADSNNHRVRKVTGATGKISTVAGTGVSGYNGDGIPATSAELYKPTGVLVDSSGNLYIADSENNRVRKVDASTGIITTVAGNGNAGYSGDGVGATESSLWLPYALAMDSAGDLFIADSLNCRIREVAPNGTIYTIAGGYGIGYSYDGIQATYSELNIPTSLAIDGAGNIYIADSSSNRIRKLTPQSPATVQLPSVSGIASASAFGGFAAAAPGSWIEIYGSNLSSAQRSWTSADFSGNSAPTSLSGTRVTVGGLPAYIDFVSGYQVNVQIPSGVGNGPQPVVVQTAAGSSAPVNVTVNSTEPGLLATSSFVVNNRQYVQALFANSSTYVLPPGTITGVTSQRPQPGQIITLYGVGFGPVIPVLAAGQIAQQPDSLAGQLAVYFAGVPAQVTYAGLAPGFVGLYQINVVVPNITATDIVPLTFTLNGVAGTQTLYTVVQ
ncbi:MAG: IPT/TIG domain-containing protein [Bryobacteraceae bacterium]